MISELQAVDAHLMEQLPEDTLKQLELSTFAWTILIPEPKNDYELYELRKYRDYVLKLVDQYLPDIQPMKQYFNFV